MFALYKHADWMQALRVVMVTMKITPSMWSAIQLSFQHSTVPFSGTVPYVHYYFSTLFLHAYLLKWVTRYTLAEGDILRVYVWEAPLLALASSG